MIMITFEMKLAFEITELITAVQVKEKPAESALQSGWNKGKMKVRPKVDKMDAEKGKEGGVGSKEEDAYEFKTSSKESPPVTSLGSAPSSIKEGMGELPLKIVLKSGTNVREDKNQNYIVIQGSEGGESSEGKTEGVESQDGQGKAGRQERVTGRRGGQLDKEEGGKRAGRKRKPQKFLDSVIYSSEDEDDPPYSPVVVKKKTPGKAKKKSKIVDSTKKALKHQDNPKVKSVDLAEPKEVEDKVR